MTFLKQHARFLIALLVLVTLVGYGYSSVSEMADNVERKQNTLTGSLKTHYKRIFDDAKNSGGNPANVQAMVVGEKIQRTQELEGRRNALMAFRPDPRFTLDSVIAKAGPEGPADADKVNYFYAVRLELKRELARARYFKPDLDKPRALGFDPPAEGVKADQVAEFLLKMDIARELCHCVERSGVQVLESLAFDDGKGSEGLALRGLPSRSPKKEDPPYLQARALTVNVRGTERAIYNLLIELQRPVKGDLRERYLAIENFELSKPDLLDPADNLVSARILTMAYHINSDAIVPGGKKVAESSTPVAGAGRFR